MNFRLPLCCILIVCLIVGQVIARQSGVLLQPDAVAYGMGGAGIAASKTVSYYLLNPAANASLKSIAYSISHTYWLGVFNFEQAQAGFKLRYGAITAGVRYLYLDTKPTVYNDNNDTHVLTFNNVTLAGSYALSVQKHFRSGITMKYISEEIAQEKGNALLFDAGVQKGFVLPAGSTGEDLTFGLSVRNIGSAVKLGSQEVKPVLSISAGVRYVPIDPLCILADIEKQSERHSIGAFGASYSLPANIELRSGVQLQERLSVQSGIGVKLNFKAVDVFLDYSFSYASFVETSHWLTVRISYWNSHTSVYPESVSEKESKLPVTLEPDDLEESSIGKSETNTLTE